MTDKFKKYEEEYVSYNLEMIDMLEEKLKNFNATNKKEATIMATIVGHMYSIFYRLKGVKDLLKSQFDYELIIPEKYDKYLKGIKEPFYLKDGKLYTEGDMELDTIINNLKEKK